MRVLVCGSRDFTDRAAICRAMQAAKERERLQDRDMHVVHGDAPGADRLAGALATVFGWSCSTYPADWSRHGRGAGPIRNQRMLDEGKPDIVLAFVNKPLAESRGTADMVRRARAAGVPTYVIEAPPDPTVAPRPITGVPMAVQRPVAPAADRE